MSMHPHSDSPTPQRGAAPHFTLGARNALYGVIDTPDAADGLHHELHELGFVQAQMLYGRAGLRELDEYGRYHGLLCRMTRVIQHLTREREFISQYAAQLHTGHVIMSLRNTGREHRAQLKDAFDRYGAHAVHHYGLLVVDILTP